MTIINRLLDKIRYRRHSKDTDWIECEYCPRCEANLTLQKGYSNDMSYWKCMGCGELLLNPEFPGQIVWRCDGCGALLNEQEAFSEDLDSWKCLECGYINSIDQNNIFLTADEYENYMTDPYKGISDRDALYLSLFTEVSNIDSRDDIILVRKYDADKLYVKKILSIYDESVFAYLKDHPITNMPRILETIKSDNNLIVIEEYIEGRTLLEMLEEGPIKVDYAVDIIKQVCSIIKELHSLKHPIIHRDIKPSNIIVTANNEVYLLDINVAKMYKEDEVEDTRLLGTKYYAAPEQLGYGFSASTVKSDIYAIGILLNVLITGKLPKEEKATEPIWGIIERCICLEANNRYSDDELINALECVTR